MDELYGIVLTDHQQLRLAEIQPDEGIYGCARRNVGCRWIELVEVDDLAQIPIALLIDEEGKLKDGEKFVNALGSYLYKSQEHGDLIVGNAMIVKYGADDLHMLTADEAKQLTDQLEQLRLPALETISCMLGIQPQAVKPVRRTPSITEELKKSSEPHRQSGKKTEKER